MHFLEGGALDHSATLPYRCGLLFANWYLVFGGVEWRFWDDEVETRGVGVGMISILECGSGMCCKVDPGGRVLCGLISSQIEKTTEGRKREKAQNMTIRMVEIGIQEATCRQNFKPFSFSGDNTPWLDISYLI